LKIQRDGLLRHDLLFFRECCSNLVALVKDNKPSLAELDSYSRQIVDFYPQLECSVGKTKWVNIVLQLFASFFHI